MVDQQSSSSTSKGRKMVTKPHHWTLFCSLSTLRIFSKIIYFHDKDAHNCQQEHITRCISSFFKKTRQVTLLSLQTLFSLEQGGCYQPATAIPHNMSKIPNIKLPISGGVKKKKTKQPKIDKRRQAKSSQSQGTHNPCLWPPSFFVAFCQASKSFPPTSCALPMFFPEQTMPTNITGFL